MALKLIIYDLDGTLVDTIGDIIGSLNKALRHHGLPACTMQSLLPFFGHGLTELVIGVTGSKEESVIEAVEDTFRGLYYGQNLVQQSRLYPGIKAMIHDFYHQDIIQAVLTNKTEKTSKELLRALEMATFFSLIVGPDTYHVHKPDPEGLLHILEHHDVSPDEAIMIGDSETDIWAAKRAKVRSIAVLYGYKTKDSLASSNPDYMVETVEELKVLLVQLSQAC